MALRRWIGKLLALVGLETTVRELFYAAHKTAPVKGVKVRDVELFFSCPTPDLADYFQTLDMERAILVEFLERITPGMVVWDVGAHVGVWTLFCAKRLQPDGMLVAFEPDQEAASMLERNVGLNELDNVVLMRNALGSESGTMSFYRGAHGILSCSSLAPRSGPHGTSSDGEDVSVLRADDVVGNQPELRPQAIKIDVEGAELKALQGFGRDVWEKLELLVIEVHPDLMEL